MNFLIPLILALAPAQASDRYLDCLFLIEEDVETGRRAAQIWADEGGGISAQHCLAIADIAAGFSKLGAARLESIAERTDAGDGLARARLYAQAIDAWLEAGEIIQAEEALAAARERAPDEPELQLAAAKISAAKEDWHTVIAAVTAAEESNIGSAEAFVFRGRAHLAVGNAEQAAIDVVKALTLEPTNIDALTLRGDVQRAGVTIDVSLRE